MLSEETCLSLGPNQLLFPDFWTPEMRKEVLKETGLMFDWMKLSDKKTKWAIETSFEEKEANKMVCEPDRLYLVGGFHTVKEAQDYAKKFIKRPHKIRTLLNADYLGEFLEENKV